MADNSQFFTQKFSADFNTSQDSLKQIASHEWNLEMMFVRVYTEGLDTKDIPVIKSLYHYIVKIYADRLYAIMWANKQDELKEKETEIEQIYLDWIRNNPEKVPTGLVEKLRLYKRWLYEVKQKSIKMGIPTKIERSSQEAVVKAIEG
jgi:hypothetical protein